MWQQIVISFSKTPLFSFHLDPSFARFRIASDAVFVRSHGRRFAKLLVMALRGRVQVLSDEDDEDIERLTDEIHHSTRVLFVMITDNDPPQKDEESIELYRDLLQPSSVIGARNASEKKPYKSG